jgi:hypothetical protein
MGRTTMAEPGPNLRSDPPQLDYAPSVPWHRRRRLRCWVALALCIIAAGFVVHWRAPLRQWAQRAELQRQCMRYHPPEDKAVYEEEAESAAALIATGGEYTRVKTGGNFNTPVAIHVPDRLTSLAKQTSPPLRLRGATLFLHARTSPAGNLRIVVVQRVPNTLVPAFVPYTDLEIILLEPSWRTGVPQRIDPPEVPRVLIPHDLNALTRHLRIYAGQPDDDDSSHFTIAYESHGQRGTSDGWLQDDDTVRMQVRGHPVRGPSARATATTRP